MLSSVYRYPALGLEVEELIRDLEDIRATLQI